MSNKQRGGEKTADRASPCKSLQLETWWNDWVAIIETERTSAAPDERLKGILRQLVTEASLYSLLALVFTCAVYMIGEFTTITIMTHPMQEGPLYMGSVLAILFTTMWDSWIRKTSEKNS